MRRIDPEVALAMELERDAEVRAALAKPRYRHVDGGMLATVVEEMKSTSGEPCVLLRSASHSIYADNYYPKFLVTMEQFRKKWLLAKVRP